MLSKFDAGRPPRRAAAATALVAGALALSACAGPTYGTGTPAEQQLLEDISGALSLAPKRGPAIDYTPRPGIVKPPSTEVLPPPQERLASASNPAWPESPEQRLARIRAEATANQDNPSYRPNIVRDMAPEEVDEVDFDNLTPRQQREEVQRRKRISMQGEAGTRRYLSDPPVEYRDPAQTAPVDEMGVDEAKKERAKKAAAGDGNFLRRLIPWL